MKSFHTIKVNFCGGIISPGDLYNILVAAGKAGITRVKFGLRQQLLIDVSFDSLSILTKELNLLNIQYEVDNDEYPNIVSSYPAEEVFITNTWLSEGVYKDIFDLIDYKPKLKINISDSNQSFTPLLTGNINWVAAPGAQHFWHLFIRFPKTNVIYEWKELVYTNDVARMSRHIETLIFEHRDKFYDNPKCDGDELFKLGLTDNYITKSADAPAKLPSFKLPYYEGLNRYQDKYWLGIYRRDELFTVNFLKDLCQLCLKTKIGQLCSTPWKSIIVKSIEEKDRPLWNILLADHLINVRHAANELNFQVEDNCKEGLQLKNYLLHNLHADDTRTFGICIGIKTRKKSEVFSSILVRRRPLITIAGTGFFYVYDILCAKDFNPNERTGFTFSSSNPKFFLAEQLRRAIFSFYNHHQTNQDKSSERPIVIKETAKLVNKEYVFQCKNCFSVYEEKIGEPEKSIWAGTSFDHLPDDYCCPLCETPKKDFVKIDKNTLYAQPV
ncbi:MAG: rubredoxin [Bacteroidia bacterium]|nr:rubredoxin [Bacteroidia bacterium]